MGIIRIFPESSLSFAVKRRFRAKASFRLASMASFMALPHMMAAAFWSVGMAWA
jgi:hypothetical protein